MRTSRLEAFSDGVMAIIITIMVLGLRTPIGASFADLRHAAGTGLLSYLLSFIYVGIYWNNHHHMFQLVKRVSGSLQWANLALLFCLSLFPYTTEWMNRTDYARVPVLIYGVNMTASATAYFILQMIIIHGQGTDSLLKKAIGRDIKGKVSAVLYVAGLLCGLAEARVWTWCALGCYVAVAVMWVVPDRRIDRVIRDFGEPG